MIKRFMILGLLSFSCIAVAQEKKEELKLVEKQRKNLLHKINSHPFKEQLSSPKKLPNGKLPPDLYFKDQYLRTMDPSTGEVPKYKLADIRKNVKNGMYSSNEQISLLRMPGANQDPWVNRGPYNVGGRTRAIMFDPNDTTGKKVFAGGVSGGLWVNNDITDQNSEWQPIGDFWADTSISCITYDPNDPMTFYVGTGEVYTGDATGLGIFKTTDGGQTWTHIFNNTLGYTNNGRLRGNYYITDIKVRDNNGQSEVFVGVSGSFVDGILISNYEAGLYKSTDGTNFERIQGLYFSPSSTTGLDYHHSVNKIEIGADNSVWVGTRQDPFSSTVIGGKIFKSTDGTNFSLVYQESTSTEKGRVELATSSQNPNVAYALIQTLVNSAPVKIIKTEDGGVTWTEKTIPSDADTGIPASDFTRGQSSYDLEIAVDPANDDVYVGGIDLFKSTNGATSWTQISKWSNNNLLSSLPVSYVHADQHAIVFNPQNSQQMLFGCDGGVFYAPDNTSFVSNSSVTPILARNTGYNVTQFYSAKMNPTSTRENEQIMAGAQDNGTILFQGQPNSEGFIGNVTYTGGDGGYVEYDDQGLYVINGYVYSNHYLTNLESNNIFYLLPPEERSKGNFINEITLDKNQDVAFVNRTGISYNVVSGLQGANFISQLALFQYEIDATSNAISKLTVSPYNTTSSTLYVGTYDGRIFKVENANLEASASHVQLTTPIVGTISDIKLGLSENEILATVSNYNVNNIWYSNNGGQSWQQKDGNFPDMPVRTIFMNPNSNNEVMIGTDLGVWSTSNFQDENPTWSTSNNGLANVTVTEFDYRESDGTVSAATYGRGVFTTNQNSFLGTENVGKQLSNFVVYPQPSKGDLHIMFDEVQKVDVKIFNAEGKLVFEQENISSKEIFNVDLPKGIYILEAIGENNFKKSVNLMMK